MKLKGFPAPKRWTRKEQETVVRALAGSIEQQVALDREINMLRAALFDALDVIDRMQNCSGNWTVAEVLRLNQIRKTSRGMRNGTQ
jgi:hypothetical protein